MISALFLPCRKETRDNNKTILWRTCYTNKLYWLNVSGSGRYIVDGSRNQDGTQGDTNEWERGLSAGLWSLDTGFEQTHDWKLAVVLGEVKSTNTAPRQR